jgi:hypothetical protein
MEGPPASDGPRPRQGTRMEVPLLPPAVSGRRFTDEGAADDVGSKAVLSSVACDAGDTDTDQDALDCIDRARQRVRAVQERPAARRVLFVVGALWFLFKVGWGLFLSVQVSHYYQEMQSLANKMQTVEAALNQVKLRAHHAAHAFVHRGAGPFQRFCSWT